MSPLTEHIYPSWGEKDNVVVDAAIEKSHTKQSMRNPSNFEASERSAVIRQWYCDHEYHSKQISKAPAVGFLWALDERNTNQTTTTPADVVVGSFVISAQLRRSRLERESWWSMMEAALQRAFEDRRAKQTTTTQAELLLWLWCMHIPEERA